MIGVSVIVAICNVGKYLRDCIQSVLNQSYDSLQIVLVNDGSTDNSSEICHAYEKKDPRIVVVDQSNRGLISARKTGLSRATEKYVYFMDGDDWIDQNFLWNMVEAAEQNKADLVVDSYMLSYNGVDTVQTMVFEPGVYDDQAWAECRNRLIYAGTYMTSGINPSVWNKLFLREALHACYENVPSSLTLGEDFAVTIPYAIQAKCVVVLDSSAYYHYRQRKSSMVKRYNPRLLGNVFDLMKYLQNNTELCSYSSQLDYYYLSLTVLVCRNQVKYQGSFLEKVKRMGEIYLVVEADPKLLEVEDVPLPIRLIQKLIKHKKLYTLTVSLLIVGKIKILVSGMKHLKMFE